MWFAPRCAKPIQPEREHGSANTKYSVSYCHWRFLANGEGIERLDWSLTANQRYSHEREDWHKARKAKADKQGCHVRAEVTAQLVHCEADAESSEEQSVCDQDGELVLMRHILV
ncbi:hypothetical protein GCM10011394_28030 [Luteimonas terricola]|uniref:Uncharacterized protein n=1 Tax=Luteimonas terricola TaxID=645597 RepID=A0ABQ2EMI8_9GAMM|nr:hypothetical protein GCM10011394_28030 [Luteimonas terricola]